MDLIYIDESGQPKFSDDENYVVAAMVIHESDFQKINDKVIDLKQIYWPGKDTEQVELHMKDAANGKIAYKGMPIETRKEIIRDTFKIISDCNCKLIAVEIRKENVYDRKKDNFNISLWGHRLLFERICKILTKRNARRDRDDKPKQNGLLLIERVNDNFDEKRRKKIRRMMEEGTLFGKNEFIIEDPLFVNSRYRHLNQLVDHVAYCVRRKFRSSDNRWDRFMEDCFNDIKANFDRCPNGNLLGCGIKRFP